LEVAVSKLPGTAGDNILYAYIDPSVTSAANVMENNALNFLYTEAGGTGDALPRSVFKPEGNTQDGYIYAKSANGNLAFKYATAPTNESDIMLKIDYSPKQNHY